MKEDALDCRSLRRRADQCRHLASGMRDKSIHNRLLEIAVDYDALARQWEGKQVDLAQRLTRYEEQARK